MNKIEEEIRLQFQNNGTLLSYISNYIFSISGKRLRPALALLSAKTISQEVREEVINFAIAVELIHAATLVHDDILDGAITRRGQKSVQGKWGSNIAVLVGDNLYAKGFSLLSERTNGGILNLLSKTVEEMCEGEGEQAKHKFNFNLEEETYLKIIGNKTARFMSICCKGGALLNGASQKSINVLEEYGFNLGMAYQIIDDCLDIEKDVQNGEITLPLIRLLEIASPDDKEAVVRIMTGSNGRVLPADFITDALDRYSVMNYVIGRVAEHIMKAKEKLEKADYPLSASGDSLVSFADYISDKTGRVKIPAKQSA